MQVHPLFLHQVIFASSMWVESGSWQRTQTCLSSFSTSADMSTFSKSITSKICFWHQLHFIFLFCLIHVSLSFAIDNGNDSETHSCNHLFLRTPYCCDSQSILDRYRMRLYFFHHRYPHCHQFQLLKVESSPAVEWPVSNVYWQLQCFYWMYFECNECFNFLTALLRFCHDLLAGGKIMLSIFNISISHERITKLFVLSDFTINLQ